MAIHEKSRRHSRKAEQSIISLIVMVSFTILFFSDVFAGQGIPVFPGAQGFGTHTQAGRGGEILRVTNLNDSGVGSFRWALEESGIRVVLFEVGGTIKTNKNFIVNHPYITVAGQTAPSPGITITGAGIAIRTHDVLLQHVRIRVGDDPNGPGPDNRDALYIEDAPDEDDVYNVVVDHCSLSWAIDENVSLWYEGVRNVTISNCIISEALRNSLHPKGKHSKGFVMGSGIKNVTLIGNLFAHNRQRNPLVSPDTSIIFINNLVYNYGVAFGFQGPREGLPTIATIVGNIFLKGPETGHIRPVYGLDIPPNSRVFIGENIYSGNKYQFGNSTIFAGPESVLVAFPPVWISNLTVMKVDRVESQVLIQAGARPGDRDATDQRIITQVRQRTGRFIDTPLFLEEENSPNPAYRGLSLPEKPQSVTDSNGYTDLEKWLHDAALKIESLSRPKKNPPVLKIINQ